MPDTKNNLAVNIDSDLIEYLNSKKDKNKYINTLIRKEMKAGINKKPRLTEQHTKEDCIKFIRKKYDELSACPRLSDFNGSQQHLIRQHFGNLNNSLEAAGIQPKHITSERITTEKLLETLVNYYNKYGERPTTRSHLTEKEIFTPDVYKKKLGCNNWDEVLEKARLPKFRKMNSDNPEEIAAFTRKFIKDHQITSIKQLLKHKDYPSEDFIQKRFETIQRFAAEIELEINYHNDPCQLSDDYLIDMYKKVSEEIGAEQGATINEINTLCCWPAHVFTKRFGSMKRLRLRSGYTPTSESRYSEKEIMTLLANKAIELNRMFTRKEIDKDPNIPCATTCEGVTGKKFARLKTETFELVKNKIGHH